MRNILYKIYKRIETFSLLTTIIHYLYGRLLPSITGKNKSCKYNSSKTKYNVRNYDKVQYYKNIKIAFVCDEMTYKSFKDECNAVFLTPSNWLEVMQDFEPDIFFCESAWNGIEEYRDCWRGKIYKNENVLFNNRKDIFNILDYCKKSNIKTVFWNKEDPIYFDNPKHNFSDTAVHFDYIFTTSKECVAKYKALGHKNVHTLMFGFSEKIFNPINSDNKKNEAIFAGSWYADQTERCKDMLDIFEMIQKKNIELKIYDRNYNTTNPLKVYPSKFNSIIHKNMPFEELTNVYKKAAFAININTIKNSETMFARRVFELMACNTCVISNDSVGMRNIFGKNVWFLGEDFDIKSIKKICSENVQYVMENHTNTQRIKQIYNDIGLNYIDDDNSLTVIYEDCKIEECKKHFDSINYKEKYGFLIQSNKVINIQNENNVMESDKFIKSKQIKYFIIFNSMDKINYDIKKAIVHFGYLKGFVGISGGREKFSLNKSDNYYGCLFKGQYLKSIKIDKKHIFNKFVI